MINEEFLHFVWKFQLFDFSNLKSTDNIPIQVVKPGTHNHNAGPDFLNAKIRIGGLIWYGDVELHIKSSDWLTHKHHTDQNYNTVVLHVVYDHDKEAVLENGQQLNCLELVGLIPDKYLSQYDTIYHSISNLPCSYSIGNFESSFWSSYSERLIVEKLELKLAKIQSIFLDVDKDYQACFYRLFAYALGLKINAKSMLDLAERSPLLMLKKLRSDRLKVEAILYGQSGLLERNHTDEYPKKLQSEYLYYAQKYKLHAKPAQQWKFFRLRPHSFPSLKISLLADFVIKSTPIFEEIFNFKNIQSFLPFFKLQVSEYWQTHYVFDKKSKFSKKLMGKSTLDLLLLNAVLPFCFFYARQKSDVAMMTNIIEAYQSIKAEDNKVVRNFTKAKVNVKSALQSQALIHLYDQYCIPRKCLNCRVFNQILKKE